MALKDVEQCIRDNDFKGALVKIDEAISDPNICLEEKLSCEVLRPRALIEVSDAAAAAASARETFDKCDPQKRPIIAIDALLIEGEAVRRMGKLTEASQLTDRAEEMLVGIGEFHSDIRNARLATLCRLRGVICWSKGDLQAALIHMQNARLLIQDVGEPYERVMAWNNVGIIHLQSGNPDTALVQFAESLAILNEAGISKGMASLLNNIGEVYKYKGDFKAALNYYEQSLVLLQDLGHNAMIGVAYVNIGDVYQLLGELQVALAYFRRAFAADQHCVNHARIALLFVKIGYVHESLGELHFALSHYMQGLAMMQRMGLERDIAQPLHRIGAVHRQLGQFESAKGYILRSLEFREKSGCSLEIAECLHDLVSMLGESRELKEAEAFLKRIKELNDAENNPLVTQYYRLTLAGLLKNKRQAQDTVTAQAMLSDMLEEDDLQHSLRVKAMVSLFELLLIEIRATANSEAFDEIKELAERFEHYAMSQQSHSLLAEAHLLHAQLALVELDTQKAERLLDKAMHLTEESGLRAISNRIDEQRARISAGSGKSGSFVDPQASLVERMETARLEETLSRMSGGNLTQKTHAIREKPVFLLVLASSGIPLYSKHFVPSASGTADDHLTAGFLAAIHSLANNAFRASGGMTNIQQKQHTLIMYSQSPLLFCYAIEGSVFAAQERLRNFAEMLNASPAVWSSLTRHGPILSDMQTHGLDNLIGLFFDPPSKNQNTKKGHAAVTLA